MRRNDLARRVIALERSLRPSGSAESKIAVLPAADLAIYEMWKRKYLGWLKKFDKPDAAYISALKGYRGPQLMQHVAAKIFSELVMVLETDTVADAQRKYERRRER